MAKTGAARKGSSVQRQGWRVMPSLRRVARRAKTSRRVPTPQVGKAPLTVGEIIAAAFDTAGGELREVLKVVSSPQLAKALRCRIILVP